MVPGRPGRRPARRALAAPAPAADRLERFRALAARAPRGRALDGADRDRGASASSTRWWTRRSSRACAGRSLLLARVHPGAPRRVRWRAGAAPPCACCAFPAAGSRAAAHASASTASPGWRGRARSACTRARAPAPPSLPRPRTTGCSTRGCGRRARTRVARVFAVLERPAVGARGARAARGAVGRRASAIGVARAWTTATQWPDGLRVTDWRTQAGELVVRYEPRYPGWKPGCDGADRAGGPLSARRRGRCSRWSRRQVANAWHRELGAAVDRLFRALAPRTTRARWARWCPTRALRARLPQAPRAASRPATQADAAGRAGTVTVAATESARGAPARRRGRSRGARGPARLAADRRRPRATMTRITMTRNRRPLRSGRASRRAGTPWEERGYFHADPDSPEASPTASSSRRPTSPASLHMGHALTITLQDILIRYKRMDGFNTLWHAGHRPRGHRHPGTWSSGSSPPRARPRKTSAARPSSARVWQWKEESGGTIIRQLKRLGASCDWARERFTMDAGLSRGGARGLRAPLGRGADLPRRLHRQLVPALPDRALRPRGGARGARRASSSTSSTGRSPSAPCGPETKLGDTGARRAPQGQALRAVRRARRSRSRRWRAPSRMQVVADEAVDPEVRHRRHQGHARATTRSTSRSGAPRPARSAPSSASTAR